jgi:opacity protein-like surface antigen
MTLNRHSLRAACAAMALIAAGSAAAADLTPDYVGADYGVARYGGRAYAGWKLGSEPIFGTETTHYLELMGFSLGYYTTPYNNGDSPAHRDFVRINGGAFNWATSTRISDTWSAKTRVGVDILHTKVYGPENEHARNWDDVSGLASAGLAYAVDRHWQIRADVNYMPLKVNGANNPRGNAITTGLDYKF